MSCHLISPPYLLSATQRRKYPHIEAFVKSKDLAAKYPSLSVTTRIGMIPRLIVYDANGASSVIQIMKWRTEDIEEFLASKMSVV